MVAEEDTTSSNINNRTRPPIPLGTGHRLTEVLPPTFSSGKSSSELEADISPNTAHCENYLCPDTLACVHFPHHCPCAWPSHEDKFELADGQRICISRGGFKAGEAARKVELARKGLL